MEDFNFEPVQAPQFAEPTPAATMEETPSPKRGRGRPKKAEQAPSKPQTKNEPVIKEKTGLDLMDDMQRQIEANEIKEEIPGAGTPLTQAARNIIDGYMLLTVCDTFFPWLFKMFYKKAKDIKDKDIRLSKDQKEHMAPLADEIAAASLSFMDPTTLFFILMGSIYKQNIDDAIQRNLK